MKKQRQFLFFVFMGIFLLSIVLMNRFVRSSLKQSIAVNEVAAPASEEIVSESRVGNTISERRLVPDDPAKYNIKVQGRTDILLTEQQWEYQMQQGLSHAVDPQALAGIQKTPQEINERLQEIETQIKEYEAIAYGNPGDQKTQERLQTLYMLKATLTVLKDKVASPDSALKVRPNAYE